LLGIWGDAASTGKSTASDLVSGKKTLPVLYGLSQQGVFARRWAQGSIQPDETPALAMQLEAEGARSYVSERADQLTGQALEMLKQAHPVGEAGQALSELARRLLKREN
jgi:geranylgeranyl diphosphate synthase type I